MAKQLLKRTLPFMYAGVMFGILWGGIMMQAAWVHNTQGEIHGQGYTAWFYWISIGFSWFVMLVASFFTLGIAVNLPFLIFKRYKKNKQT